MATNERRTLSVIRRLGVARAADLEEQGIPRRRLYTLLQVLLKWKGMEASTEGDFYVRSGPGSVRLTPDSAREYIRTRLSAAL